MRKTLKVSIGGLAFTIEEDAYNILDNYLSSLKEYYKDREEGEEIISDVESRVSELLQMKISSSGGVVTVSEVREIVGIMGKPEDFDDKDEQQEPKKEKSRTGSQSDEQPPIYRKKLFRDPSHAILSGVCGGLGYFFRIDPVIVRLIFIAAFFAMNFFSTKSASIIILIYLILWVVMPKATTFRQKLSMVGTDPSLGSVVNRGGERAEMYNPNNSKIGTTILQIIKITIAVILLIVGFSILIGAIGFGACYAWFDYPVSLSTSINDLIEISGLSAFNTILSTILLIVIPAIVMIYIGLKLFRRFTIRDLSFVAVLCLIWIGVIFYIGSMTGKVASQYSNREVASESVQLPTKSDSLFIKLDPSYIDAELVIEDSDLGIYKKIKTDPSYYFFIPKIVVNTDTTLTDYKLDIKKAAFARSRNQARLKAENARLNYVVNDSLIVISPNEISRKEGFNKEVFEVTVNVPANKKVIIDPMLENKW